jgi:DNA polymerase-4
MAPNPTPILHVDMDAFYASIEQRDRPELRGRPVIVGGLDGRGVVCAASYEARPFGVHSAMPMRTARRLCPQAIYLPVRMRHYARIGQQIREIFLSFTPLVEPLSLDEAFLDVRGSDHGKPDGFVVLPPERVTTFLAPLPVGRLWGVGAKGEKRLHALGLHTVGQLAALPEEMLVGHFGDVGRHVWQLANGKDERAVVPDREAKSISTETTFPQDIDNRQVLRIWLLDLVDHLCGRLRQHGLRARTVELKIRSSDFRTRSRAQALPEATNSTDGLWQVAAELFERSLTRELLPVRLLGVGVTRLTSDSPVQRGLFDGEARHRQGALDQAIDAIRGQFGTGAIQRGSLLDRATDKDKDAAEG